MAFSRRKVFATTAPSPQTAVDAVLDAWASRLPSPLQDVQAGDADLFDDRRIRWAFERLGGVSGASVLELGRLKEVPAIWRSRPARRGLSASRRTGRRS